jgi:hypothetical protein
MSAFAVCNPFKQKYCLYDLLSLGAEVCDHFENVHFLTIGLTARTGSPSVRHLCMRAISRPGLSGREELLDLRSWQARSTVTSLPLYSRRIQNRALTFSADVHSEVY